MVFGILQFLVLSKLQYFWCSFANVTAIAIKDSPWCIKDASWMSQKSGAPPFIMFFFLWGTGHKLRSKNLLNIENIEAHFFWKHFITVDKELD